MDIRFNELSVGGKSLSEFGIFLSGAGAYSSPVRQYDKISVPGRNGDLIIDKGCYDNIDLSYKCIVYDGIEGYEEMRAYLTSLVGYQRLEDSFHPDEYRIGILKDTIAPSIKGIDYDAASFELTFDCKPQRFLKSGEESIVFDNGYGQLYNETPFDALPLIRVYTAGTYVVNGQQFNLSYVNVHTDVDCDIMDVYEGSTNRNYTFSGQFPKLKPGENSILGSGKIDIIPRWYLV